jgi:phosphinothricin acetyltransferase
MTTVRLAHEDDFGAVCAIVNHYIATTTISFRMDPQTPAEWITDWQAGRERYPWLVAEREGEIAGVAYAAPWKTRPAYDWTTEVTGYVAPGARGGGVGRALYARLLASLDAQGFRTAVAVIALPNEASVGLHESFGFAHAGTLTAAGYKNGVWCDTGFWQRSAPGASGAPPLLAAVPRSVEL